MAGLALYNGRLQGPATSDSRLWFLRLTCCIVPSSPNCWLMEAT